MSDSPNFNLNCADGGRGYIKHRFSAVLKRYDYTRYINERLAGDFACTLAQHFEDINAREAALQALLTAADERADVLATENKRLDLMVSQADYSYDADRMQFKARIDELEGLLRDINDAPGGSRFKKHIDAALKPAEGDRDDA